MTVFFLKNIYKLEEEYDILENEFEGIWGKFLFGRGKLREWVGRLRFFFSSVESNAILLAFNIIYIYIVLLSASVLYLVVLEHRILI